MNKIIGFFLPQILKTLGLLFGASVLICISLRFTNISMATQEFLAWLIMLVMFCLVGYFNQRTYLSSSLNWITLTPVRKRDIILAHGLLNMIKLLIMLIGVNLYFKFFTYRPTDRMPLIEIFDFLSHRRLDSPPLNAISCDDILVTFIMILFIAALIFGILPNYLKQAQAKQDYHVNSLKKNPKKILVIVAAGFALLVFATNLHILMFLLPEFMIMSLVIVSVSLGFATSTLPSVKYYYNKRLVFPVSLAVFIVVATGIYCLARADIYNQDLELDKRMDAVDFIGRYGGNDFEVIVDELRKAGPNAQDVGQKDIKVFFSVWYTAEKMPGLMKDLEVTCEQRRDHSCYLLAAIDRVHTTGPLDLKLLEKSCPKHLWGCYFIVTHPDAKIEDKLRMEGIFKEACDAENRPSYYTRKACESYHKLSEAVRKPKK